MRSFNEWSLKPESAAETEEASTPQGMRKRLRKFSMYDGLTSRVRDTAHVNGWSGEDEMTVLAYHALLQLEELRNHMLRAAASRPVPGVMPPSTE